MATVVLPSMSVSNNFIDFGEVKCGECCIVSIQLQNNEPIVCNWEMKRPKRQVRIVTDKTISMFITIERTILVLHWKQVTSEVL